MYSGVVNDFRETEEAVFSPIGPDRAGLKRNEVFERWRHWPVSEISHHGAECCEASRKWLLAMDFSALGGESQYSGPRWLNRLFSWGASEFPIYWCEAVRRDRLDCGALAALSYEIYRARGVMSFRVQMVQRFSNRSVEQWRAHWGGEADLNWTAYDLIYHEGCAILSGTNELKIWDSSAGWWVDQPTTNGYGSLLAIRISDRKLMKRPVLEWKGREIAPFAWTLLMD